MRVALVKQALELHGPWASMLWQKTSPEKLFEIWPWKATYWEMTCLLKADWFILSKGYSPLYHKILFYKQPELNSISSYVSNVIDPGDLPFEKYDVVIFLDPVLKKVPKTKSLVVYYMNEHIDPLYRRSLKKPVKGYDLFLAHMLDAENELDTIPKAVSFPYMRAPDVVRSIFNHEKEEAIWVDWRTLATLTMTQYLGKEVERTVERLQNVLGLSIRYADSLFSETYGYFDPPRWGDPADYLEKLSRCKYYIAVGRSSGAGQGLGDALSLEAICFGEADKAYHRLSCHPACLCQDMSELLRKFNKVAQSPDLQAEILDWQEKALRKNFVERPLAILEEAISIRQRG